MIDVIKEIKNFSINDILEECDLYLKYPSINENITIKTRNLKEKSQVQGLLK